ncbi:MAG: FecR domain-containing protein [Prolixibacteraceae bacterium]|nr:FecR domain-containing protein [Prolixibacteraceae bacterium]
MENQTDINILLIRLFSGEADLNEKKRISDWLDLSAENKKLYSDLREIWLSSGIETNADNYDLESAILKFRDQINKDQNIQRKQINFDWFLKYAAILALALLLPFSYYMGTQNNSDNSITTISCAYGDKSSIILPDNSHVWLNSGSKLTFNSNFKDGRKVSLEGEAYFDVAKDKHHPFQVKTADVQIEVLGTKFNLKAYPDEKLVSTTLVEGSVKISSEYQHELMTPDQKMTFDKESKQVTVQELTDTSSETDWKDGRFVFRNETLAELKPRLERWFDVDIVFVDDQVKNRRFTGVLGRESILEAVSYFDRSNYVSCSIQGNKIIINSQNN